MFKDNSRFASLIEEKPKNNKKTSKIEKTGKNEPKQKTDDVKLPAVIPVDEPKRTNFFKNEPPPRNNYSSRNSDIEFQQQIRKAEDDRRLLEEERKKEEEKKVALAIESFPSLCTVSKPVLNIRMNFIEKFAEEKETDGEKEKDEKKKDGIKEKQISIGPGWSEIKFNKETNKINIQKKIVKPQEKGKEQQQQELDLAYNVLNNLVHLHEKRTDEYIEKWGYNEWERTFQFPNYDYSYFDKLDEKYEEDYGDNEDISGEESGEDEYWKRY